MRSFCAAASKAFGTMTQCHTFPLPTMCTLIVLFFGLLTTLPDSPHHQTPPGATATHLPRQRRAYLSRPTLPSADSEQLYGWDCFSHPHQTKGLQFRQSEEGMWRKGQGLAETENTSPDIFNSPIPQNNSKSTSHLLAQDIQDRRQMCK